MLIPCSALVGAPGDDQLLATKSVASYFLLRVFQKRGKKINNKISSLSPPSLMFAQQMQRYRQHTLEAFAEASSGTLPNWYIK